MTDPRKDGQSTEVPAFSLPSPEPPPPAERPAFSSIYEAELDYVWRSLRRLGARPADLEDLAHEVFLVVHRRLADYDPARPLRPWLFGIALRVMAARRRKQSAVADEPPDLADPSPPADERVEAQQARDLLAAALARLPIDQRAVVVLHDLDGLPAPEIAAALEITTNTAYSRLRLGREKLAAEVKRLRARGDL